MKKLQVKHWQDPVIALLGAWFAISPWALDTAHETGAVAASLALGLALLACALGAMIVPQKWEHWSAAAIALGIAVSPWLLGYADIALAPLNALGVGLVSGLLALWVLAKESDLSGWSFDRLAH